MKRFLAVLTALIMLFTLFSAVALAAGTESESMMTDRGDDPASYDTAEGLRVQRYIIVALFALGLVAVIIMVIKNYISGK